VPTTTIDDVQATGLTVNDTEITVLTENASRTSVTLNQFFSLVFNHGRIYYVAASNDAVIITGGYCEFHNREGATVVGDGSGITINASGHALISNEGLIVGNMNYGINVTGAVPLELLEVTNHGDIFGANTAIYLNGGAGTIYTVENTGFIRGVSYGIYLDTANGILTLNNAGTISSVEVEDGRLNLTNSRTVLGNVHASSAADVVVNNGFVYGEVSLGGGNDVYRGAGRVGQIIEGESGNDSLTGGASSDVLKGGTNNDVLVGGLGQDHLYGESGNDTFRFTSKTHSKMGAQADIIYDFDDFGFTGDRIDVSALFGPRMVYIHAAQFSAAGQVRINDVAGPDVVVEVNTGGSLAADFAVRLKVTTLASMNAGDFIL
jgi:Ca2+-binding RTX toxin-like protein